TTQRAFDRAVEQKTERFSGLRRRYKQAPRRRERARKIARQATDKAFTLSLCDLLLKKRLYASCALGFG
ncbi:MAG: hypothetical protein ACRC1U_03870, partial [Vibrionaceae bacterium]